MPFKKVDMYPLLLRLALVITADCTTASSGSGRVETSTFLGGVFVLDIIIGVAGVVWVGVWVVAEAVVAFGSSAVGIAVVGFKIEEFSSTDFATILGVVAAPSVVISVVLMVGMTTLFGVAMCGSGVDWAASGLVNIIFLDAILPIEVLPPLEAPGLDIFLIFLDLLKIKTTFCINGE
jgi:hypothetical protein